MGNELVTPVMLFFTCEEEEVTWQDQVKDGSHLIVRGPKVVRTP